MLSLSIVAEVCREARAGTAVGLLNAVTFISSGLLIAAPSWFLPANPDVAALVRSMLFFPATIVVALAATALLRHRLETSSG
jgi:hypothetical protein